MNGLAVGKADPIWRGAAAAALLLGTLVLVAAGLAGPAYRIELISRSTAFTLLRLGAWTGIGVGVLAVIALVLAMALRRKREWPAFALAALFCGIIVFGVRALLADAESHPPIHDVTTNLSDPPAFVALEPRAPDAPLEVPARSEAMEAMAPEERWRAYHQQAYGDLEPLVLEMAPDEALAAAEAAAREMGWEIAAVVPEAGRLEATATTAWFGFKDDVVVRVRPFEGGAAQLDVRSVSRIGVSDLGKNAARIRAFLDRVKDRAGPAS